MARELTERSAILNLQTYLRQLSFFDNTLPELPLDGIFASETRRAVEIFQENHSLPVTGEADRVTWDAIYEAYRASVFLHAKPVALDIFYRNPSPAHIRRGDLGFQVAAVQYMLNEILTFYSDVPEIHINGSYDEQTADAVGMFQGYADLPKTGEVDLETWNRMAQFFNELFRHSNQ